VVHLLEGWSGHLLEVNPARTGSTPSLVVAAGRAKNHLSKSVVRDTEGAAKQKLHATFCGNRGRAIAPGDPVVSEKYRNAATRRLSTLLYARSVGGWR
jgi:hypothetical protein